MRLTPAEFDERAQRMARKRAEAARVAEEKKNVSDSYKHRLNEIEAEIDRLARAVESRSEDRDVEVIETRDETAWKIRIIRVDTHEEVESRGMNLLERAGVAGSEAPDDDDADESEEPESEEPDSDAPDSDGGPVDPRVTEPADPGPLVAFCVTAGNWERVPPANQALLRNAAARANVALEDVAGGIQSAPIGRAHPRLSALVARAVEMQIAFGLAPAGPAVPPPARAEPGLARAVALHADLAQAADAAALEAVWPHVVQARDDLAITAAQYGALDTAWGARKAALRAPPKRRGKGGAP